MSIGGLRWLGNTPMPIRSDELIPLMSGAYTARSDIANSQICENLFPEINPESSQSPVPMTHYQREGKRLLADCPIPDIARGVFTLSNGQLIAVVGANVYAIDQLWNFTTLGQIPNFPTPVSIADNGTTAVLVDGSINGYTITMPGGVFAQLVDGTGTFNGSFRTDFSDTFLAFATPGTNQWEVTLSNTVTFNALVQANKDSTPDPIQTLAFNLRQMWLIGSQHSEVWFLAGSVPFPYQSWPNLFIPYGTTAIHSLCQADIDLFWLSSNQQGQTIAVKTESYGVVAISTRALEYEWSTYANVADVVGCSFQQAGHTFIVFHFPSADVTWAYDLSTKQWHRRTWIDQDGVSHRERSSFCTSVGPVAAYPATIVAQDWETGALYALDPQYYTDNGTPIVRRRTFPHVVKDLKEITHTSFVADFDTSGVTGVGEGDPQFAVSMRYSNDGGKTFGNYRQKPLISSNPNRSMMRWRGLGMARDRVYELQWSFPSKSALNGAYIEPIEHGA